MKPANPLRARDYQVLSVGLSVCQDLCERHHYARGGSNTGTYCHGLFRRVDASECLGIAWWIPPTKAAAMASYSGDWQRVLCLTRLVIIPGLPTNAATFLLSKSVRLIQKGSTWECLITYADTWQRHVGTIYRAADWEYVGLTKPESVWVGASGRMVARKAGPKTRTASEMEALGYRCQGRFSKHKFRKLLPSAKIAQQRTMWVA